MTNLNVGGHYNSEVYVTNVAICRFLRSNSQNVNDFGGYKWNIFEVSGTQYLLW